jgi:hypothetical protein
MFEDDDKEEMERASAVVREVIGKAMGKYEADLRLLQGTMSALCATVTGLAAASPHPERVRIEIQRAFHQHCAAHLGQFEDDETTKGVRQLFDILGERLGGVIL